MHRTGSAALIPALETERLRFRAVRPDDLDRWAAVMAHPVTVRHFGGEPVPREETWRKLLAAAGLWAMLGYGYWAVERKSDGLLVGQVGFSDFKRAMTPAIEGVPEAGWILAPDAHGVGYAAEAVREMLRWADRTLPAPVIAAIIDPDKAPSVRVAEKTGFSARETATYKDKPILLFERRRSAPAAN